MDIIKTKDGLNNLINETDMLLVYFGSNSCSVCHSMLPKVEKLLVKYPKIKGVRVETENSVELSANFSVFTIPVIILFIQGKETIREARIISIDILEQEIKRYYELFYGN